MKYQITLNRKREFDALDLLSDGPVVTTGILTDEHSQSSYGIPVIVVDGQVMGAADIAADTYLCIVDAGWDDTTETSPGVEAAKLGGYDLTPWAA